MALFDAAIFDSAIFDTGADVVAAPQLRLPQLAFWEFHRQKRDLEDAARAERAKARAAGIEAVEPEPIIEHTPDRSAFAQYQASEARIQQDRADYEAYVAKLVARELAEIQHVERMAAEHAAHQMQMAMDEEAARAFLSWLMRE